MEENPSFNLFPRSRVKAFDGMSITADVWTQAHGEHRQSLRAHERYLHGAGIISGLDVMANDPPDRMVFITPGVAVDPVGNVIVLEETVAYDFGASVEGSLFLVLGHGERESGGVDAEVHYLHDEFVIAARPTMPKRPVVELARVTLSGAGKPIKMPAVRSQPHSDELDLRFRSQIGPRLVPNVYVGLASYGANAAAITEGWKHLSRECLRSDFCNLIVDDQLAPGADLTRFDIFCVSASGSFTPGAAEMNAIEAYLAAGKVLLAEARDVTANESFEALFQRLRLKYQPVSADDDLLSSPYLFGAPPAGQVLRGKQVTYSTTGFSPTWSGKLVSSRAEIRSAHEWGINLLNSCLAKS